MTKLYVMSETNCRGDVWRDFNIFSIEDIKIAQTLFKKTDDEYDEYDEFISGIDVWNISELLCNIVNPCFPVEGFDPIKEIEMKGYFNMEGEETCWGVGETKALAKQAFLEIQGESQGEIDGWGE